MSGAKQPLREWRLGLLIVGGVVLVNIVAAVLVDRHEGLGLDEVAVVLLGVVLALVVEYGLIRRRRD